MTEANAVAIVGMACRFPGAVSIREFRQNLGGAGGPGQAPPAAILERIECFDAGFFGFNRLEASVMDPQHRHLLEVAWEALEDAGYSPEHFAGSIGVFAGSGRHTYFTQLVANRKLVEQMGLFLLRHTGNDKDFLTTRISYCLNLTGPSLNIQCGQATSLAAIHLAARSLLSGECEMALAGGVDLQLPLGPGQGSVPGGSGAGMVVLRRVRDAIADGDHIYAVMQGSALQHGGQLADLQAACAAKALANAAVAPGEISFIEEAMDLGVAGGVAGVIKAALALDHRQIYVNERLQPWQSFSGGPLRAGVTSISRGGAIAHVVLGEAPAQDPADLADAKPSQLVCLSARSESALERATVRLAGFLRDNPGVNLADAAYTLLRGRRAFSHRRTIACLDVPEAIAALESKNRKQIFSRVAAAEAPPVTFMFSGGGAQYPGMGRQIYGSEPVYRQHLDECLRIAQTHGAGPLRGWLFPEPGLEAQAAGKLQEPGNSILSVFIVQYALAQLWMSYGVQPAAMIGHSLGEVTAACLAGVMSLEDAIRLVIARGRLFEALPEGAMLSVSRPEAEIRMMIEGGPLCIAAINAADLCLVSGPVAAVAQFEDSLSAMEIECQRIKISVAAHSSMIEPFLEDFARQANQIEFALPRLPYISNLHGNWADPAEVAQAGYWVRHLREAVRFSDGLDALMTRDKGTILLEVGPGTTMGSLARRRPAAIEPLVVASLRHPSDVAPDHQFFLAALGRLWAAGCPIDWQRYYAGENRRRISLPTYPFEQERHWIGEGGPTSANSGQGIKLAKLPDLSQWFSQPSWKMAPLSGPGSTSGTWLVIGRDEPAHRAIAAKLRSQNQSVVVALAGKSFVRIGEFEYTVNPVSRACLDVLLTDLADRGLLPSRIVDLLPLTSTGTAAACLTNLKSGLDRDFFSLLTLMQAWGEADLTSPLHLTIVTNGAESISAGDSLCHPEKAVALGLGRVIPREYSGVTTSLIDLDLEPGNADAMVENLLEELLAASGDPVVAWRSSGRWVQGMESVQPGGLAPGNTSPLIRHKGLYLITGGLGGIGLKVAEFLVRSANARLILIGRTTLPAREQWGQWLDTHSAGDSVSASIGQLQKLEELGGSVRYCQANIADLPGLQAALGVATAGWGPIHGVIHAAGVIDDEMIQMKTRESAEWVFAPKMAGTLALESALGASAPDFFVMFSSTSAWLGLAGQADYAAANAFLDAFARSRNGQQRATKYLALGWGVWAEVGMAAKAAGVAVYSGKPSGHPLLGLLTSKSPSLIVYHARYSARQLWVLDEHRLRAQTNAAGAPRQALLPGTGYLEIARASLAAAGENPALEIRNLFLMAPLAVPDDGEIPVRVTLRKQDRAWRFAVASYVNDTWVDHATAEIEALPSRKLDQVALTVYGRSCNQRRLEKTPGAAMTRQEGHLAFGPRWDVLRRIDFGAGEALAVCELAPEFWKDLESYPLHPAILDMAIHVGLELLPAEDSGRFYVPMSFQKVRAHAPLTGRLLSHICLKSASSPDVVSFDVALLSASGELLLEITDFTVKRVSRAALTGAQGADESSRGTPLLKQWLSHGILPAEGVEAFGRALETASMGSLMVSSIALPLLRASLEVRNAKPTSSEEASSSQSPPRDEYERTLCALFQDLLGVEQCGIQDDFFELGGHSLVAVRLFNKIRKAYGVELGLAVLFQAPTVEQLAGLVREQLGVVLGRDEAAGSLAAEPFTEAGPAIVAKAAIRSACLVPIQPKGHKRPLFLMPGWGGNVLGFQGLSRHLGKDQPLYGLQSLGLDGQHAPFTKMEAIAEHFLKEIRTLQPEGPYLLGGMSFGGMVAFEMAQQLRRAGQEASMLAILDTLLDRQDFGNSGAWARLRNTVGFLYRRVKFHSGKLIHASPAERSAYWKKLLDRFRRRRNSKTWRTGNQIQQVVEQMQAGIQIDLPQAFKTVNEANLAAIKSYQPKPFPGHASLYRATDQGLAGEFDTEANWRHLVPNGLRIHAVPGHHLSILEEPNVRELAARLTQDIELAERRPGKPSLVTEVGWRAPEPLSRRYR